MKCLIFAPIILVSLILLLELNSVDNKRSHLTVNETQKSSNGRKNHRIFLKRNRKVLAINISTNLTNKAESNLDSPDMLASNPENNGFSLETTHQVVNSTVRPGLPELKAKEFEEQLSDEATQYQPTVEEQPLEFESSLINIEDEPQSSVSKKSSEFNRFDQQISDLLKFFPENNLINYGYNPSITKNPFSYQPQGTVYEFKFFARTIPATTSETIPLTTNDDSTIKTSKAEGSNLAIKVGVPIIVILLVLSASLLFYKFFYKTKINLTGNSSAKTNEWITYAL